MSKVLLGCLLAGVLVFASGCKGGAKKSEGDGCGCAAEASCGEGCAAGCNACGEGCTASCGCGCGCGGGCGCACACGDGCGDACSGACSEACSGGCGCGSGNAMEVSDADARHAMRRFREYRTWAKANAVQFKSKPHKGMMIWNYVNNLARDSWQNNRPYPNGAAIAKEGHKKGARSMIFLMEKRGEGYDTANGDWWYATVAANGKVMNAGKVSSCINCHENADNDHVFGTPK